MTTIKLFAARVSTRQPVKTFTGTPQQIEQICVKSHIVRTDRQDEPIAVFMHRWEVEAALVAANEVQK